MSKRNYDDEHFGGETGIRTLGRLPFNGFQDRRNRPLCHLSTGNTIPTHIFLQILFYIIFNKTAYF